jgi:osmotically-inducible protein OsmY
MRTFVIGMALGAGTMYLLDPDKGRRRRALARDQVVSALNTAGETLEGRQEHLRNRAQGLVAETAARIREDEVDDRVLAERVRSRLGRLVSHPGAIDVSARDGCVILHGPVLKDEVDRLLSGVSSVRGVRGVENQLEVHDQPGDIPSLQGG